MGNSECCRKRLQSEASIYRKIGSTLIRPRDLATVILMWTVDVLYETRNGVIVHIILNIVTWIIIWTEPI